MSDTKIEWADKVWNPVTGCSKVSTGCKNCYAERLFPRVYGRDTFKYYPGTRHPGTRPRKFINVKLHPDRLNQPLHWKKPRMVFVNSMSDLFHEDVPDDFINKIWTIMLVCHRHTFQILTKRPERMAKFFKEKKHSWSAGSDPFDMPKNIWLGVSIENQETADERIPFLLQVPTTIRFLSCEPLLDRINLNNVWAKMPSGGKILYNIVANKRINWIIVGGESGPNFRPMHLNWAREIRDQCKEAGVPFFFKQTAGKKEIPEDLMIREYPK